MDIQLPQVDVRQELLHEICGAGALRTDPDGCPAKIREGVKGTAGTAEHTILRRTIVPPVPVAAMNVCHAAGE
jgi:hypothetical protein